jgi:FAD/FMN-containing dehydrogenase
VADSFIEALVAAVGARDVLVDDDVRASYETDWTRRFHGRARAVVRPGGAAEVAAVLATCREHGAAVVAQGGNTGMVGGGVPRGGEVVLSLGRLRELGEVDRATAQVTVSAGVTLAALQAHARAAGLDAGVDFGGRDSATVGGMVATNAGGIQAMRHGTVRARVAGLQAVLADGAIVDRRSGLLKDNAGYDLPALLVGSEGTLGVVTSVRWRLVPLLTARVAALIALPSVAAVAELLARVRPALSSLNAAELMTDEGMRLVLDHLGASSPLATEAPAYLLLECAGTADPTDELVAALDSAGVRDAVGADEAS